MKGILIFTLLVFQAINNFNKKNKVDKIIIQKISFYSTYPLNITSDIFNEMDFRSYEVKDSLTEFIMNSLKDSKYMSNMLKDDVEVKAKLIIKYYNSNIVDTVLVSPTKILFYNDSVKMLNNDGLIKYLIQLDE